MKAKAYVFVIGNEKGGAGKTTCSMHLIGGLLKKNYKVASIDTDVRQLSLSSYINNRQNYNAKNAHKLIPVPDHFNIEDLSNSTLELDKLINKIKYKYDYVVIDTPGSYSELTKKAHFYADTIITPINDSFIDLDVMAKIDPSNMSITKPSIYSQMIWEQKIARASLDGTTIEWLVVRNRLSNLDAVNKRNVNKILQALSKRIAFKIADGFSERVIFKELFLHGLTLLDLDEANHNITFSLSHVAARQELRNFFSLLNI